MAENRLIVCVCRLKEVTPDKIPQVRLWGERVQGSPLSPSTPQSLSFLQTFSEFWKNDVRQARKGKYRWQMFVGGSNVQPPGWLWRSDGGGEAGGVGWHHHAGFHYDHDANKISSKYSEYRWGTAYYAKRKELLLELSYVTLQGLFDEVAADSDVNQLRRFVLLYLLSMMSLQHHGDYIVKSLKLNQWKNISKVGGGNPRSVRKKERNGGDGIQGR